MNVYWDHSLRTTTSRVDMSLHPDILMEASIFCSLCMNGTEVANSNFIALDVTAPGDGTQLFMFLKHFSLRRNTLHHILTIQRDPRDYRSTKGPHRSQKLLMFLFPQRCCQIHF